MLVNEPTTQMLLTIDNDAAAALQVDTLVRRWAAYPAPVALLADGLQAWLGSCAEQAMRGMSPGTLGYLVAITGYTLGMGEVDWLALARHYAMELAQMDDDALARRAELYLWTATPEKPATA